MTSFEENQTITLELAKYLENPFQKLELISKIQSSTTNKKSMKINKTFNPEKEVFHPIYNNNVLN